MNPVTAPAETRIQKLERVRAAVAEVIELEPDRSWTADELRRALPDDISAALVSVAIHNLVTAGQLVMDDELRLSRTS